MLNKEDKQYLLKLAKGGIGEKLGIKKTPGIRKISEDLKQRRACFVTLTINGQLRGCIGNLEPADELWQSVTENAKRAAFEDPRFEPMTVEEFGKVEIEISVLEEPKQLDYKDVGELVEYLGEYKPGVILKKGWQQATFLPQVWDELETPEEFLGQLCLKAGLDKDEWQRGVNIETYGVEVVK